VKGRLFLNNVSGPGDELSGLCLVDDLGVNHGDPAIVLVSNNPTR
jgi:hypothetical protein